MLTIVMECASAGRQRGRRARRTARKLLLVFFSRAGENYFNGGRKVLKVGNTEVVAGMIRDALGCDVFQIRPRNPTIGEALAIRGERAESSRLEVQAWLRRIRLLG